MAMIVPPSLKTRAEAPPPLPEHPDAAHDLPPPAMMGINDTDPNAKETLKFAPPPPTPNKV